MSFFQRIPDYLVLKDQVDPLNPQPDVYYNPWAGVIEERQREDGCNLIPLKVTPEGTVVNNKNILFQNILEVLGQIIAYEDILGGQRLEILDSIHIVGGLNVDGPVVIGTSQMNNTGSLFVHGPVSFNGTLGVSTAGNTTISGSLGVTGPTTLTSLAVSGNETVGGNITLTGNETIGGTLSVSGNETVGGNITLTGNETIGGTLSVTGTQTFTGKTNITTIDHIPQQNDYTTTYFGSGKTLNPNLNRGMGVDITSWTVSTSNPDFGTWNATTGVFLFSKTGNYEINVRGSWFFSALTALPGYITVGFNHSVFGIFGTTLYVNDDINTKYFNFSMPLNILSGESISFRVGSLKNGVSAGDVNANLPNIVTIISADIHRIC